MRSGFARHAILVALLGLGLTTQPAHASLVSFYCITPNQATDCAIGQAQMQVEVSDPGGDQVKFTFTNLGPTASSITDVYFDDGPLLGISSIVNGLGVKFSGMARPRELPGANNASPPFVTSVGFFSTGSTSPTAPNGINPVETLMIFFDLQPGVSYADVLAAFDNGELRIGLHVQGYADGGSVSLVSNPVPPGPRPAAVWMFLPALGAFGVGRRRSRRYETPSTAA